MGTAVLLSPKHVAGAPGLLGEVQHELAGQHRPTARERTPSGVRKACKLPWNCCIRLGYYRSGAALLVAILALCARLCAVFQELAHYALATTDIQYKFPFGWDELWGIANRGDYDLTCHSAGSGVKLRYTDPVTKEVLVLSRSPLHDLCELAMPLTWVIVGVFFALRRMWCLM